MNNYELERIKNRELVNGEMYIFSADVRSITKLGRTTIYQMTKAGKFPKPIDAKLKPRDWGNGKNGKLQLWKAWVIYNWMEVMANKRGTEQ